MVDPADEDPIDLPAGVPSARSNKIIIAVASAVAAIPLLALLVYSIVHATTALRADDLGSIDIRAVGQAAEAPFHLKAGDALLFGLGASYRYSGNPAIMLEVSLRRGGSEVAETRCNMKSFKGFGSMGTGHQVWYGDMGWHCVIDVPPGDATSVRVTVTKQGEGSLSLSDMSVLVKRK
jgi:hypothetical protein